MGQEELNMSDNKSIFSKVQKETNQSHHTRVELLKNIEKVFKKKIVVFQNSFVFDNGQIEDEDALMIEEILRASGIKKNLLLIINSPGGFGLAAERMVRTCRKYSGGSFETLVPNMAKSAATLVCLGSKKIWMSKTSELGPVDPQIGMLAVHNIIKSYEELMEKAENTKGRIEPFLQQLQAYDPRYIQQLRQGIALSSDMAIKFLKSGMMKGKKSKYIEKKIEVLTNAELPKAHGRPLFIEDAKSCGLNVGIIKDNSKVWDCIWELQMRYNYLTKSKYGKLVESVEDSYVAEGYVAKQEKK
jgi:ClpP class serine protease